MKGDIAKFSRENIWYIIPLAILLAPFIMFMWPFIGVPMILIAVFCFVFGLFALLSVGWLILLIMLPFIIVFSIMSQLLFGDYIVINIG